ncbi:MAG TPA: nucleotidyltransferase domain-containing protein [Tissierellaceae bacterium]
MELKKCNGIYNSKLDFKMLCFLNKDRDAKESLKSQKEIYLGKREEPKTFNEKHLKQSLFAYKTLLESEPITLAVLEKAFRFYSEKTLDKENLTWLVELVNKRIDDLTDPVEMLMYVIKNNYFHPYSREMAIILFNVMLVKSGFHPIIFYINFSNDLIELIKNGALKESVMTLLKPIIKVSMDYNQVRGLIKTEEVVRILKENESTLKDKYHIIGCFIYGSVARGEQTEYSDIDLVFLTQVRNPILEKEIRSFVESLFIQKVDLVFISKNRSPIDISVDFYTDRIYVF